MEKNELTQADLVNKEKRDPKTIRKYTKHSAQNPDGVKPYVTPRETPISRKQKRKRVDYATENEDTDFYKENWSFVDTTPVEEDGVPNRKTKPQWVRPRNKNKKVKKAPKHKHCSKFQTSLALNRRGCSKPHIHAKRRKLKSGPNKGKFAFTHLGVGAKEMARAAKKVVVPFMKETNSKIVVMDCTRNNHNDTVRKVFEDAGIYVYPSAGYTDGVKNGYPPNSHDCMPNETFHSVFKNQIYSEFRSLPRERQNMNNLYNLILKVQKQMTPKLVAPHIKKLPAVMKLIIQKKGGPTGK